ncbi:CPBP family intramembrane metalloprotease [Flavobacterium arcticum]|uniref:CPBP family intramembrane metalloprotease n=1 Tax=Flavobacterium arcticum TaxID=1784713 RepID=A0A345HE33_9FLAO|nr:CPBP family intramembrane glutamic endopeptidase [Flavobacterium arcticum]AXG74843.1 CPBP family intramembrane metalloprotease [Flavobacterium arcticum]KAF2509657.1 CPBP family intramembrane metalloprotease [Flavobacterium arcticum]
MYIKKAYSENFDFVKYLPIPIVFLGLIVLNYAAIALLNIDVEELLREEIAKKGANRVFIETLLPMAVLLGVLLLWVKYVQKQSITSLTTAREEVDWKRIWFSFGLWGGITALLIGIAYVTAPENFVLNFKPIPFAILAVTAILMVPLQTSFEEYFFRGYLMQGIGVATRSRLIPLIITSVLFGVMHIANPEVGKIGYILLLYYIGTGFLLGIMTLMDDGIELALGFHAANNLISALLVTSDWTAFQTDSVLKDMSEPSAGFDILVPLLILYPILLFIFSRKYGWSGWKEKLTGRIRLTED